MLIAWIEVGKSVDGVSGSEVVVAGGIVPPMQEPVAEAEEEAAEGFAEPSTHISVAIVMKQRVEYGCGRD